MDTVEGITDLRVLFLKAVSEGDQKWLGCTIEDMFESHAIVFAAEESRKKGIVVLMDDYLALK